MSNKPLSPPPQPPPGKPPSKADRALNEFNASVASLRTEADRSRNLFGFGRRIIVPPDEIHVVVGDGYHTLTISSARKVFGQSADRPSRYWLNALTQVIKLKTISFTVPLRGYNDEGVEALDNSKVSFRLWAHAVAKLNPEKAEVASQRVGLDTTGLINTITEVGTAELVATAATMDLQDIIASRQRLAEIAFPKVNQILSELGYDLALLTVTKLEGVAYQKLVEQAEARVSKETSIATNQEQVAELQDDQARKRTEAEIQATTEMKLAAERLEAQRSVETATLSQQESLAVRRHEVEIKSIERQKTAAETAHLTEVAKVELARQLGEAEAEKNAQLARLQAERDAELRAIQTRREAELKLMQTQAEAERLAAEQARQIERAAERTQAEAKRLREEELAKAQRAKEVALLEANQLGEALTVEADAQARALQTKTDAESKSELMRAQAEATAAEKRAQAAKIRAEATRAEAAAPGLAAAEVESARVVVAEKQVAVNRAEGLAAAEVARAQAEAEAERLQRLKTVEIEAQQRLVDLYDRAPVLVELERVRMDYAHAERLASIRAETALKAVSALAPGIKVHLIGNGGQASQLLNELMTFSLGLTTLSHEVPAINRMLNGVAGTPAAPSLAAFGPFIQQALAEVNPRVFSSLKVSDLVERLGPVVAGQQDLVSALDQLRRDASFRVVGDLPLGPILQVLGLAPTADDTPLADESAPPAEKGSRPE